MKLTSNRVFSAAKKGHFVLQFPGEVHAGLVGGAVHGLGRGRKLTFADGATYDGYSVQQRLLQRLLFFPVSNGILAAQLRQKMTRHDEYFGNILKDSLHFASYFVFQMW